jgi:hypothetical protein
MPNPEGRPVTLAGQLREDVENMLLTKSVTLRQINRAVLAQSAPTKDGPGLPVLYWYALIVERYLTGLHTDYSRLWQEIHAIAQAERRPAAAGTNALDAPPTPPERPQTQGPEYQ